MPELADQMYCSQQIVVPPHFPYILKKYAKAAIKTQPYDLLRWSFEYFRALADRKTPPVKLRLEYPIFSTEGGLTRGYLKVLANQLSTMDKIPFHVLRATWQGSCLDRYELTRILCLCEVYLRKDSVPRLQFLAVAGALLTKSLTHTMILLCETLTKEPDGGSAAIPVDVFLNMYQFLSRIDASADVKYINGYREGTIPEEVEEEMEQEVDASEQASSTSSDDFWENARHLHTLSVINDSVPLSGRLSMKLNMPLIGTLERSSSVERAKKIERDNLNRERKVRVSSNPEIDEKLRVMSSVRFSKMTLDKSEVKSDSRSEEKPVDRRQEACDIHVYDEHDVEVPYELHGEPLNQVFVEEDEAADPYDEYLAAEALPEDDAKEETEAEKIVAFVANCYMARDERLEDLVTTFDEINGLVDKFNAVNYDLGVIAGRQMSSTSGEFVAHYIERDIMDFVNEQIAVLPDPDLKKKKAKPEEVQMIKDLLEEFLNENMDIIVPEVEEVVEEELPIPDVIQVYAVPGIGPLVPELVVHELTEYALEVSKMQADLFMPRNVRHFMCPPLEKYHDAPELQDALKEEVPKEGVITE